MLHSFQENGTETANENQINLIRYIKINLRVACSHRISAYLGNFRPSLISEVHQRFMLDNKKAQKFYNPLTPFFYLRTDAHQLL